MEELEVHDSYEVYFASTVQYVVTYKGKEYSLRKHEDSNGGEAYIRIGADGEWEELYDDSHDEVCNELNDLLWEGALD
tara:strand:- start:310 stop:543 length:234 start_codon:yes stop_codon:yes gene_type:complete